MLHCRQHWSPLHSCCFVSPACTDSSKALSISPWAIATSVHAAGNTMQQHLFYYPWGPFSVKCQFTADGCPQNNSAYTCTWSATLVMILPSLYHPWWEWSISCYRRWTPNQIQWKWPTVYQHWTQWYFFWLTTKVGALPSVPSQKYASAWEQDSVLTRLLSPHSNSTRSACFLEEKWEPNDTGHWILMRWSQQILRIDELKMKQIYLWLLLLLRIWTLKWDVAVVAWWDSGDAQKYEPNCDMKAIVLEWIGILESFNCSAMNWKNVINARFTSSSGWNDQPLLRIRCLLIVR